MDQDNPHPQELTLRELATRAGHYAQRELEITKGPNAKRGLGPIAVAEFHRLLAMRPSSEPPLSVPKKLAVFIAKCTARLSVTYSLHDAARPGRTSKVSQSVVDHALRQVRKRYLMEKPYRSLNEAAHSAYFKHVLKQLKITIRTLWRHMRATNKTLNKHKQLFFKQNLSRMVKDARVNTSVRCIKIMFNTKADGLGRPL